MALNIDSWPAEPVLRGKGILLVSIGRHGLRLYLETGQFVEGEEVREAVFGFNFDVFHIAKNIHQITVKRHNTFSTTL